MRDLRARASHFEFGRNWGDFVENVANEDRISDAVRGLSKLFPDGELRGRRMLDIGSGSGLSMLAALRLGAAEVVGFDIDENSVAAARSLLERFAPGQRWQVSLASIFDASPGSSQRFDVVHSWGVLHHTGDMWAALANASQWVADDGMLAVALYAKSPFCGLWRLEKRLYTHMHPALQAATRGLYKAADVISKLAHGQNPIKFIRNYRVRGMSWTHDVHDWLGGYPYQSASPEEVHQHLATLGFSMVRENIHGYELLGSSCDEYVARRIAGGTRLGSPRTSAEAVL
jgi:2-polyprenyl-3-methyl-5-hydroxy-6-metoxy-1,4-benzoquinol methylase